MTQNEEALKENLVSEKEIDTLSKFQFRIDQAKMNGDEWVETSPAIMKYFNRGGLGTYKDRGQEVPREYFIYQGIKVCGEGAMEGLIAKEGKQLGKVVHGDDEATVNQIKATRAKAGI